ncbi:MAG: VWA domain-containing protein [Bacteroidales bacterium]|nr:VWA domain-containing protein [Bacteroidales bacterium]
MKRNKSVWAATLLGVLGMTVNSPAQETAPEDKTLSPYFVVIGTQDGTDPLPLKSTSADVNIAGVIADVRVIQEYGNEGNIPLEAIYIFPASTNAAVYRMVMTIGERTITARISEREQARMDYEQALQEGRSASLLEQQRPNVFQMNVGNIMPGDIIRVELSYTELLIPESGIYTFIYPTVVGPRYSNTPEDLATADERWIANPYTHEGVAPAYDFRLSAVLSAGMPVAQLRCPSHDVDISWSGKSTAQITLKTGQEKTGNKDFILEYQLRGGQISTGLLLYRGEKENFFLAMVQPPEKVSADLMPPREYVFIVDVSGSMYGYPLDVSKKLMKDLLSGLVPGDRFNILLFAGGSELFSPVSVEAGRDNISRGIRFIDEQQGGGGTELLPALQRALALPGTQNHARTFVIVTDGYVSVEREAFDLIRQKLDKANFFPFGIGTSVNRYLIEGLAHAGQGVPFIVTDESGAAPVAEKFREYVQSPVLTHLTMSTDGFQVYDVEPASIPDVFAERPVLVYGKWRGNPTGTITVSGRYGRSQYVQTLDVSGSEPAEGNSALAYLWAREKIRTLDDYASVSMEREEDIREVTRLGLAYSLLTRYTSFVAIDSEVRNPDGTGATVHQPLPLPEGVSDYAVGAPMSSNGGGLLQKLLPGGSRMGSAGETSCDEHQMPELKRDDGDPGAPEEYKEDMNVYRWAATMPQYRGGEDAFEKFITKHISKELAGTGGEVYVEFTVEKDGSVSDIRVIRGVSAPLDAEACRLVGLTSGKWTPGYRDGAAVRVRIMRKISFQ